MPKPMMLRDEDDDRILSLQKRLGSPTKIDVLRQAMLLLEKEADRRDRVRRWQDAVKAVGTGSMKVNAEFRPFSRLKRTK